MPESITLRPIPPPLHPQSEWTVDDYPHLNTAGRARVRAILNYTPRYGYRPCARCSMPGRPRDPEGHDFNYVDIRTSPCSLCTDELGIPNAHICMDCQSSLHHSMCSGDLSRRSTVHWLQGSGLFCDYCGVCIAEHCRCEICSNCGWRTSAGNLEFCTRHNACPRCHTHNDDAVAYIHRNRPYFWTPNRSQRKQWASTRYAALEVEFSSWDRGAHPNGAKPLNDVVQKWRMAVVQDGSLGAGGREINTAPAAGDLLITEMTELADALKAIDATANQSCGLHCHVDIRDFDWYDVRRLMLLWEKLELAMFQMVPTERRNSSWCHKSGLAFASLVRKRMAKHDVKRAVVTALYERSYSSTSGTLMGDDHARIKDHIQNGKRSKHNGQRYRAMNLDPWLHQGTVEFRLPEGSVKLSDLLGWPRTFISIVDYARKSSDSDVEKLPTDSYEALQSVLSVEDVRDWANARMRKHGEYDFRAQHNMLRKRELGAGIRHIEPDTSLVAHSRRCPYIRFAYRQPYEGNSCTCGAYTMNQERARRLQLFANNDAA